MVGSSPFFEDHFFLDHPWDQKEEEANDNFTDQEIEPESSIEESNQERIENKEAEGKTKVATSCFSDAVFILKDQVLIGWVVKDGTRHTSDPIR